MFEAFFRRRASIATTMPRKLASWQHEAAALTRLTPLKNNFIGVRTDCINHYPKMYAGWNFVLPLIISLLCHQTYGLNLWPFSSVAFAKADEADSSNVYADPRAKRIAIIGTSLD